jgi:hypothetical protein
VVPVPLIHWILVFVVFRLSGYFLIVNSYLILALVCVMYSGVQCVGWVSGLEEDYDEREAIGPINLQK